MFTSKLQLRKRTPENGTDRENFLSLLVDEYLSTASSDAKCQILANFANFAYDPINYSFIRKVGVLDIFLYVLKNENHNQLKLFAVSGICNLCLDPVNVEYILTNGDVRIIVNLLNSDEVDIVTNAITTLIYICGEATNAVDQKEVLEIMQKLSKSSEPRVVNLAIIYIQDVCHLTD